MNLKTVLYGNVTLLDLIGALLIFLAAFITARILTLSLRRFLKEKMQREPLEVLIKVIRYTIVSLAAFFALPLLGIELSGLVVAGGMVAVAIGIASQNVVGNLVAGISLMIERPIKIGNGVNIDGITGIIEDIRIMSTHLRSYDGLYIRVPNQKVLNANIINFVTNQARRIDYDIGIRYSDNADKAMEIIKSFLDDQTMVLKYPEPLTFISELGDNAIVMAVKFWAPVTEWYTTKTQLLWHIRKILQDQGIDIPFPQRMVWFGNEASTKEITEKNQE